ncbi:hypothetical protein ABH966_001517 [Lysinibacillus sp. RC46]
MWAENGLYKEYMDRGNMSGLRKLEGDLTLRNITFFRIQIGRCHQPGIKVFYAKSVIGDMKIPGNYYYIYIFVVKRGVKKTTYLDLIEVLLNLEDTN